MPPAGKAEAPGENPVSERARRRRAVFPSRAEALASYRQRPLFSNWKPRLLELYVEYGFRERDDGQVELKCAPQPTLHVHAWFVPAAVEMCARVCPAAQGSRSFTVRAR